MNPHSVSLGIHPIERTVPLLDAEELKMWYLLAIGLSLMI